MSFESGGFVPEDQEVTHLAETGLKERWVTVIG